MLIRVVSLLYLLLGVAMVAVGGLWAGASFRDENNEGGFITLPAGLGLVGLGFLLLLGAWLGMRKRAAR